MVIDRQEFLEQYGSVLRQAEGASLLLGEDFAIPDGLWKVITELTEMYVSADSCGCVLSDSLRKKGIYLAILVLLLKTINNFVLRRNGSQILSAKEGEVSVAYQSVPVEGARDWFMTDPIVQPFGMMLWQLLNQVQPCPVVEVGSQAPYYPVGGQL